MNDTHQKPPSEHHGTPEDQEQPSGSQMRLAALADRYVRSKMSEREREDFEVQLLNDEDALREVELAIALSEGVAANRDQLPVQELVSRQTPPTPPLTTTASAPNAGWFPWAVALAASVGFVMVTADRAALVADSKSAGFAIEQQVLLSPYRSGSGGGDHSEVPTTKLIPPAQGGVLLEIRLPRPLLANLPAGAAVRARMVALDSSRLVLDQDVSVLRGYALIGVDAQQLKPGRYEVSVTAPADAEIVRYAIDVQAPGAVSESAQPVGDGD